MMNSMIPEMEKKISELKTLEAEKAELESLIEVLKDEIKNAMGSDELLVAGPFKVTYAEVKSNRFDSKAFKGDHPDLYKQYSKPSVTRPFKVA